MNVTTKRLDALKHPKKNVRIHSEQPAEEQNATETEPEITETRRFVVCPKCGERIWL